MVKILSIEESIRSIISSFENEQFVRNEFSPLINIFSGLCQRTTECSICKNKNSNFEPFRIFELEIPVMSKESENKVTLDNCLEKWSENEKLDDDSRYKCSFCGIKSNAIRKQEIMKTPKILIIHIKRFKKDIYGNFLSKNETKINYPVNDFDIQKYICKSSTDIHKSKYNLYAANCHYGPSIHAGHYISIVKNRFNNNWYCFNDSEHPLKIYTKDEIISQKAFILFYIRTN